MPAGGTCLHCLTVAFGNTALVLARYMLRPYPWRVRGRHHVQCPRRAQGFLRPTNTITTLTSPTSPHVTIRDYGTASDRAGRTMMDSPANTGRTGFLRCRSPPWPQLDYLAFTSVKRYTTIQPPLRVHARSLHLTSIYVVTSHGIQSRYFEAHKYCTVL